MTWRRPRDKWKNWKVSYTSASKFVTLDVGHTSIVRYREGVWRDSQMAHSHAVKPVPLCVWCNSADCTCKCKMNCVLVHCRNLLSSEQTSQLQFQKQIEVSYRTILGVIEPTGIIAWLLTQLKSHTKILILWYVYYITVFNMLCTCMSTQNFCSLLRVRSEEIVPTLTDMMETLETRNRIEKVICGC